MSLKLMFGYRPTSKDLEAKKSKAAIRGNFAKKMNPEKAAKLRQDYKEGMVVINRIKDEDTFKQKRKELLEILCSPYGITPRTGQDIIDWRSWKGNE